MPEDKEKEVDDGPLEWQKRKKAMRLEAFLERVQEEAASHLGD
jgi:hypothetical protein